MNAFEAQNWTLAVPEIFLACASMAILILGVLRRRDSFQLCSMLSVGALLVTGLLVIAGGSGTAFNGLFSVDAFSNFVNVLILVASALSIVSSLDYNAHQNLQRFEFPVLILLSTVGMMIMASAVNLMTLYLGLEMHSLALYVLAAIARHELRSSEAGLKYFVLGVLASGLLLYGITFVYGFTGTMSFTDLAGFLTDPSHASTGLIVGVVFIVAGLAFKFSAVPFHMWTPDVYEGAPTPITLLLGTAPKVAAMALLVRAMATPFGHLLVEWQQLIVVVSIATMIIGTLGAIGQRNIKRLMAYSSIAHMGYALIGLAAGTAVGIRGVLIYLVTYVFMFAGSLGVILAMRRRGRMLEQISDLAGVGDSDPGLALWMTIFMFSMAGIPPLAGFWGKFYIFGAAIHEHLLTLAVIGVLTSVMSAFYYIRVVKVIYFDAPVEAFDKRPGSVSFVTVSSGLFTALFILFPAPILVAADAAAKVLLG